MNVEEVKNRVHEISMMDGDPENQHTFEDHLHVDVLKQVKANADPSLSQMAAEALKTSEIDFPRWYA